MPGGSLLALVSYGSANVILNDNPSFTYYYKVFKPFSHFSFESVEQPLDGPNELTWDKPIFLRAKIPRVGDLLSDCMFTFDLPDIYSKYVETNDNTERVAQYEFQWARYIGAQVVQNVAFFVGGTKIQEFDSDYIIAKANADYDTDTLFKWRELIGDTNELHNPAAGIWAGGSQQSAYPTVVKSTATSTQVNRPSIFGQKIYVPLPFWFATSFGKSLPLVGLQYHECEIQLTLRSVSELYTIQDPSGFRMRPGYRVIAPNSLILANQALYQEYQDASGEFRSFAVDINFTTPQNNTWPNLNPRLLLTYAFVTEQERLKFATTPLNYLIYQTQAFRYTGITQRTTFDLDIHAPVVRILVVPRRNDQVLTRNNFANYTNWWGYPDAPWNATPGATFIQNSVLSSGLLVPNSQLQIVNSLRIVTDGQELQGEFPASFFSKYTAFRYMRGGGSTESQILLAIPFSLDSPGDQPSGSVNASRIRLFQIDFNPFTLPINSSYNFEVTFYAENINFFEVESGMGGVKYAI